jgi:hypothetical protein
VPRVPADRLIENFRIGDVAKVNRGNRVPSFATVRLQTMKATYENVPASYDNWRKKINGRSVALDRGVIFS